jgi:hypothetical protein
MYIYAALPSSNTHTYTVAEVGAGALARKCPLVNI